MKKKGCFGTKLDVADGRSAGRADMVGVYSGHHIRQAGDGGIIADRRNSFQRHVSGALHGLFVVLFQEAGSNETNDGLFIGED